MVFDHVNIEAQAVEHWSSRSASERNDSIGDAEASIARRTNEVVYVATPYGGVIEAHFWAPCVVPSSGEVVEHRRELTFLF